MSAPTCTKDGIEVKPGQVWRDLDKRMRGREVIIVEVANGKAITRDNLRFGFTARKNRPISISRMHRHSTGWELVSTAPTKETT